MFERGNPYGYVDPTGHETFYITDPEINPRYNMDDTDPRIKSSANLIQLIETGTKLFYMTQVSAKHEKEANLAKIRSEFYNDNPEYKPKSYDLGVTTIEGVNGNEIISDDELLKWYKLKELIPAEYTDIKVKRKDTNADVLNKIIDKLSNDKTKVGKMVKGVDFKELLDRARAPAGYYWKFKIGNGGVLSPIPRRKSPDETS